MARALTDYERIEGDSTQRAALREEQLLLAASCVLAEEMERQGVTKAALAARLGRTRGHVTQILSGRNLTLRTLAQVADALGCKVQISIGPARALRKRAASQPAVLGVGAHQRRDEGSPDVFPTVYVGSYGGGVFKSTDFAGRWSAVNTGLPARRYVVALALDPTAATTLYAGLAHGGVWQSTPPTPVELLRFVIE